jgi:N-acylneuraminate cytidylyltransferase
MTDSRRVLAVIPARGGSKGLPGKNIRPLAGLPLIGHSLRAAELVAAVDRVVVSTDSPEIADTARALGADVPFLRPDELALDSTPMMPVLAHALDWVEQEEGHSYDLLVLLDPTSPAREPEDVQAAIDLLDEHAEWDGVVSVSEPGFHPVWVGVRPSADDPERLEPYLPEGAAATRRQDLPRFLRVNGNFYVWRTPFIRSGQDAWLEHGAHGMVEIPEARAYAIDHLYQFETIEALLAHGVLRFPWLSAPEGGR